MSAQVLPFSQPSKGALDPLSLLQQYWLICQCDDPAERVALATSWRFRLNELVREQPELFEHVSERGYFLLIDVGRLGQKLGKVQQLQREFYDANGVASKIVYVDANQKASASNRT